MLPTILRQVGRSAKNRLPTVSCMRNAAAYEGEGKTTVRVINQDQDLGLMIDAYATYGFRLNNGITVLGPMAIFPRCVLSWQVFESDEITEESLRFFKLLEPKTDLILQKQCQENNSLPYIVESTSEATLIGLECNDRSKFDRVFRAARANGLNVEILPTEHACATFNFLNHEGRSVAGALIPPLKLSMNENDMLQSRMHYDDVFHKSLH